MSPSPEQQIAFLTNIQRLLTEGSFVSTYKYALLLALADLSVELGRDDSSPLEVSTDQLAEKFISYYWRQTTPYAAEDVPEDAKILVQNTGKQAAIVAEVHDFSSRYERSLRTARADTKSWKRMVSKVARTVEVMPLGKLQTLSRRERLEFLYQNPNGSKGITLNPGVAFCFRKHYPLITDLVKGAWVRYVRRFNSKLLGTFNDLHEFLFGAERANLALVRPIVEEAHSGNCFYCHTRVKSDPHIDHFIPWSRYPVDLGHNFVLSHSSCNGKKSDRLAAAQHLDAWIAHVERSSDMISREFEQLSIPCDLATSVKIVEWAYRQTYDCRGLTWAKGDDLVPLLPDWDHRLRLFGRESTEILMANR